MESSSISPVAVCQWCNMIHQGACPRVKAIEYHQNGTIKKVEFHELRPSITQQIFSR